MKNADRSTPEAPRPARGRWLLQALLIASILFIGGAAILSLSVRIPESGSRQTVVFYAAPTSLAPGARIDREELEERLRRLGYRDVESSPATGQYSKPHGGMEINLRPFTYPGHRAPGGRVLVKISGGIVRSAEALDGMHPDDFRLEPERIAGFEGETGAVLNYLRLDEAPPLLIDAILAVEDRRFWTHPGIDFLATGRALLADLRRGEAAQGGSTLTQQVARSLFLHNRKTILRKAQEAVLAVGLEIRYSKREILEAYLNAVYWGQWGTLEIRGAREAARYYLGCELEDADAAGLALLAGLIRAPNLYSPYANADQARARRDFVLGVLRDKGELSDSDYRAATRKALAAKKPPLRPAEASYFLEAARKEVERRAPGGTLERAGVSVFTTLDLDEQTAAVLALRQGLQGLEREDRRLRRKKEPLEGAVVAIDPLTGHVSALVGGRDFSRSPFNRATEARRQPGSLFKPFVYLAAFRHPWRDDGSIWTPATLIDDEPFEVTSGDRLWQPQNYDHEFRGAVTVRHALEQSLNVPTARVGYEVGLDRVAEAAHALGVQSALEEVPSLALGTSEVTLLEITGAYAGLAAGGRPRAPTLLLGCASADGAEIPLDRLDDPPGVKPEEAYVMNRLLEGVIDSGTGRSARGLGVLGAVAGKTGTTDDYRDAWFVGYDPHRAVGVWVGFDRDGMVGLSGAEAALPIWARAFRQIEHGGSEDGFAQPPGVTTVEICPESGHLAEAGCPDVIEEVFLAGTEPEDECLVHGGFFNRFFRMFGL
jgi:penicillin-binding protein 1B